jgi:hypothetical protein
MRQGDLFSGWQPAGSMASSNASSNGGVAGGELPLLAHQLLAWQRLVASHQGPLFAGAAMAPLQASLFAAATPSPEAQAAAFDPLALRPQPLSFWRWPQAPQGGAAIYLVIDRPPALEQPLLLYVGETGRADRRWKGEHDCKRYLTAYGEALAKAALEGRPSIRFWLDVPAAIQPRRALEQALIRRWLPPFNKETRQRWATPFTAELDLE